MARAPMDGIVEAIHRLNLSLAEAGITPIVSIELAHPEDMVRLRYSMTPAMMFCSANDGQTKVAGVQFTMSPFFNLREALRDAASSLVGTASAYRRHARRRSDLTPRAQTDPLFTRRAEDFDEAAQRAIRAVQRYA